MFKEKRAYYADNIAGTDTDMNGRQKIVDIVIGSLEIGGAERHLVQILPMLVKRGWTVTVITLGEEVTLASILENAGVTVLPFAKPKWLSKVPKPFSTLIKCVLNVVRIYQRLITHKNRKVILHFFLPASYIIGMLAAILARFSEIKIMSRRSLNEYQKKYFGMAWFERQLHKKCDAILGNSMAIIDQLEKEEGVIKDKLHLIYNGIDLTQFERNFNREKTRETLGLSYTAFVMVIVANLIGYKGHRDLLQALSKIKDRFQSEWKLLCVGRDGGILSSLQTEAKALNVDQNILWLGTRQDIPELLYAADLGILCSHEEGFSNAILEGMASQLPMVVTRVGGNAEAVLHQNTGLVVPARDPKALSEAILYCYLNPEIAKEYGKAGKERVYQFFSLEKCVDNYIAFYDALLER